ncbi:PIN domain-containing protein [Lacrimispora sp.]|uniref:PIN domain-containing protein n=1 Tax=Lacrimispora sp. TaxID=2719234 RepID=UPI003FA52D32
MDTNVLIQAPYALESFEENYIVLPLAVLEKLDRLKNSDGECGSNARQAIRLLENLRLSGNLTDGVPLSNGGFLRLEVNHVDVPLPEGMQ